MTIAKPPWIHCDRELPPVGRVVKVTTSKGDMPYDAWDAKYTAQGWAWAHIQGLIPEKYLPTHWRYFE